MPPLPAPPPIRLLPAPAYDPPFDDEHHPEVWGAPWPAPHQHPRQDHRRHPTAGPPPGPPAGPGTAADAGPVTGPAPGPHPAAAGPSPATSPSPATGASSGTGPMGRRPARRPVGRAPLTGPAGPRGVAPAGGARSPGASPAARLAAARFLNTCLEIFNGLRPLGHARQLAHPLHAQDVVSGLTHGTRRLRQAAGPAVGRAALVKVRRLRVCEPRPGTVEIAAAIGFGDPAPPPDGSAPARTLRSSGSEQATAPGRRPRQRTWAAAFRLERQHRDRWQCTAAAIL